MNHVKHPRGWYFGLPYMHKGCIGPTRPEKIPAHLRNASAIFSDDVLLQSPLWRDLLLDWYAALENTGHLILWLSDCRFREPAPGSQRVTIDDILKALPFGDFYQADIIDGRIFIVLRKDASRFKVYHNIWYKKPKHLLVARFGAHGDALMAGSALPALKAEGWHITMMVNHRGHAMLQNDPHIDDFVVFTPEQLLTAERAEFWAAWSPRFDRTINLSQTVEESLLKKPDQGDFYWPDDQRRAVCAGSYLAATHKAAQVAGPYRVKFYPTDAESAWARRTAAQLGKFILWSLHGSAPHKWWPYAPQAISQLLAKTDYTIVLAGDGAAQELANQVTQAALDYFGGADRLRSLIEIKPLRDVLALAPLADIVVGPETALTNAVCLAPLPKIVLLSHSAPSNLTDDWVNTTALRPSSPCYPCHRMHYNHDFCPQDAATGAAACAASITAAAMVDAVLNARPAEKISNLRLGAA